MADSALQKYLKKQAAENDVPDMESESHEDSASHDDNPYAAQPEVARKKKLKGISDMMEA